MVKLSIIIPYYQTYEFTKKLLDVLEPQITDEVEVLLEDDGCYETRLDEYKRIKVTHYENEGVAVRRNTAIRKAKGEYIAFIDSDDMIADNYVDALLYAIIYHNTDVINFNWQDIVTGDIIRRPDNYAVWKAIYKKSKIPMFIEGRPYGNEDVNFQADIEVGIKNGTLTITYLDTLLYYYNSDREGSLMWHKRKDGMC